MDPNDNQHQTPDDALEPADDIFNPARDEEKLEEDNDPPAAPATDTGSWSIPPDDPDTDTDMDAHDVYDEGVTSASGADEREIDDDNKQASPLEPEDDK